MTKKRLIAAGLIAITATLGSFAFASASGDEVEVTIHNISNTVITPPLIAVSRNHTGESFFTLGEEASVALEELAEGGDTSSLKDALENDRVRVTTLSDPIPPGESVTVTVPGWRRGALSVVGMLLPTNDAFAAIQNLTFRKNQTATGYLNSYDAGTEANSELFADIPGPFGGEGFNAERDDLNIVHPHPGLHGLADANPAEYNWADPVAKVTVKVVR